MKTVHALAFFLLAAIAANSLADEVSLAKFTLAPGEKRTVTVESKAPLKVGFANDLPLERIKSCKNRCIRMHVAGDPFSEVAASVGTVIHVVPTGGKAEVEFENRETFPIPISVFRR